jgi:hypothetical protein
MTNQMELEELKNKVDRLIQIFTDMSNLQTAIIKRIIALEEKK